MAEMAKLLYSAAVSLDGFIAGPGGDMAWLTARIAPNPIVDALIGQLGSLLVGHSTFRGDDPHRDDAEKEGKPFGGGWSGPQFVLTHRAPATPVPGVTFVGDLESGIAAASEAAGEHSGGPRDPAGHPHAGGHQPVAARGQVVSHPAG